MEVEMKPKRIKLDETTAQHQKTDFLSLNDDCIYKIFDWLHLDDLCSINETCKELRVLASNYFGRKHPEKLSFGMRVMAIKGKIQLQPDAKYVKSFSQCFDNVGVVDHSTCSLSKNALPLFIRDNCNENLIKIHFQSMELNEPFGIFIGNVLKNVEKVVFSSCDVGDSYHESILRHCQHLKHLSIDGDYGNKIDELLLEEYPTLEDFQCQYYGRLHMTRNLEIFLRQHPNLKRLTWCFHARILETPICDKTLECVETIVDNAKNLEELFLSFDGHYNLEPIFQKLNELSNRKNFKRLDLDFRFSTLGYTVTEMMNEQGDRLAKLKPLSGLYLTQFNDYGKNIISTLSTLEKLRILQLDCVVSIKRLVNVPLGNLTNLEELHIITLENVKFVQQFICQVGKLKKVFIVNCKITSKLNLAMLNVERQKIPGACELVIYLDIHSKKLKTDNNIYGKLVRIKYVNFEIDSCNMRNPFIQRSSIAKKKF